MERPIEFRQLRKMPWSIVRALPGISPLARTKYLGWHFVRSLAIGWAALSLLHIALKEPLWFLAPWWPDLAHWSVPWPAQDDYSD